MEGIITIPTTVHGIHHTIMADIIPTLINDRNSATTAEEKGQVPFQQDGAVEAFLTC